MEMSGLSAWCLGIDDFEPEAAFSTYQQLLAKRSAVAETILRDVDRNASLVRRQYDQVFGKEGALAL
jgi:hypothetical protein